MNEMNGGTNGVTIKPITSATSIIPVVDKFSSLASGLTGVQADIRIVDSFSGKHTSESLAQLYDGFSADYESAYSKVEYEGPQNVAKALRAYLPTVDGSTIRVLDAGCGSGLVGAACRDIGFTKLVGMDLSTGMLEKAAKKKGLYEELKIADLTKEVPFYDNTFDAVVSCGVFTAGHVNKEALGELARVTRPGGVLCIACQEHVYKQEGYPAYLESLKKKGIIGEEKLSTAYSMRLTKTEMTIVTVPVLK